MKREGLQAQLKKAFAYIAQLENQMERRANQQDQDGAKLINPQSDTTTDKPTDKFDQMLQTRLQEFKVSLTEELAVTTERQIDKYTQPLKDHEITLDQMNKTLKNLQDRFANNSILTKQKDDYISDLSTTNQQITKEHNLQKDEISALRLLLSDKDKEIANLQHTVQKGVEDSLCDSTQTNTNTHPGNLQSPALASATPVSSTVQNPWVPAGTKSPPKNYTNFWEPDRTGMTRVIYNTSARPPKNITDTKVQKMSTGKDRKILVGGAKTTPSKPHSLKVVSKPTMQGAPLSRVSAVFVSRLDPDTTESDLQNWIDENFRAPVIIDKIRTKFDSYSSFRVYSRRISAEDLTDPLYWPEGCLLMESFIPRESLTRILNGLKPEVKPNTNPTSKRVNIINSASEESKSKPANTINPASEKNEEDDITDGEESEEGESDGEENISDSDPNDTLNHTPQHSQITIDESQLLQA